MKKWIVAPTLALALWAAPMAWAQTPSAESLQLAQKVVDLQRGAEQDALLAQLADGASAALVMKWNERVAQNVPEAKQEQVREQLNTELKAFYDDVVKILHSQSTKVESSVMVNLYAQKFTEDELKALVAWYSSDVFKKYQGLAPELAGTYMQELMEASKTAVQDRQGKFDTKAASIVAAATK